MVTNASINLMMTAGLPGENCLIWLKAASNSFPNFSGKRFFTIAHYFNYYEILPQFSFVGSPRLICLARR